MGAFAGTSSWEFPAPDRASPDGLLGVGADLEPATLLDAYARGIFPMPVADGKVVGWFSPDPRGVLPLERFRLSRSLRRSERRLRTTLDQAFAEVVACCADPARPGGWISEEMAGAYVRLHELGVAHSVEVWDGRDTLVGGLFGVSIGALFAAESKFHRARDASKVALARLVRELDSIPAAGALLDVQWCTPHLASVGAVELARADYLERLERAVTCGGPPAFSAPCPAGGAGSSASGADSI